MPIRSRIGAVLILLGVGLHVGWKWWDATRTWVPLDVPISLARGHYTSPEFKINLESSYWMYVEVERKSDEIPCLLGFGFSECKNPGVLKAVWVLSSNGQTIARGDTDLAPGMLGGTVTMGRELGIFSPPKGEHYVIDIELLDDSSRLNAGRPRLRIINIGQGYPEYGLWHLSLFSANLFFLPIGTALLVSGYIIRGKAPLSIVAPQMARPPRWFQRAINSLPLPSVFQCGMFMAIVGSVAFAGIQFWMSTRIFVPVNMPVSLAPGRITTGPFTINLEATYTIEIGLDNGWTGAPGCSPYAALLTRWVLYKGGKPFAHSPESAIRDTYLKTFAAGNGVYNLDVEVVADAGCLNVRHPRLQVYTEKDPYTAFSVPALWASALCVAVGISLCILLRRAHLHQAVEFAGAGGQYFRWAQTAPLKKMSAGPPHFGLVAAFVYFVALAPIWLLQSSFQRTTRGMKVHVLKPGTVLTVQESQTQPLILRLQRAHSGVPDLYLRARLISWSELPSALRDEIKTSPGRLVFVQADSEVEWADVVKAIDVAYGLHANVVILTPRMIKPADTRKSR